ncbi:MAG: alkane 1-monooxygenase [Bacteroidia bacterium]
MRSLKYAFVLALPAITWWSFDAHGWLTFMPFFYIFVGIPLVELFIQPDAGNLEKIEEKRQRDNIIYDFLIYLMVPTQLFTLGYFLYTITDPALSTVGFTGRIMSMGLCCGVLGINVGHELGHRYKKYERWMAKINLMTTLNMHFMHEHNKHHHLAVSTPDDPATSKYGEPLYIFWFRSITGVYAWAWKLERDKLKRKGVPFFSFQNQMITDHIIEFGLVGFIAVFFGFTAMASFILAALIGHLVLETVNYIEHYGLVRKKVGDRYERVTPKHSWNSDHIVGRLHLFELSRHSDHHYLPGRKYQILRHMDESPQMPTGYPGMMILAFVPPLWFAVMNKRVKALNTTQAQSVAS